jgi:GDP-D-mannose 3',5'-epimerase
VSSKRILVTGAGGFIGGHLVAKLLEQGDSHLRAVDLKPISSWHQVSTDAENLQLDLSQEQACYRAAQGADEIYNLAADMGGMGFIEANKARCMLSVLINTHLLRAALRHGVERFFFSSSACVYPSHKQESAAVTPLRERDAYPAMPEDGYGWEKLFSERLCRHFREDFGLTTRIARYHNVYGPAGTYFGGREKAPAALCRKIAEAELSGEHVIDVWGDGRQTRSFMYITDCVTGTLAIMHSACEEPLNLGSSELVTIDALIDIIEDIAGITVERHYDLSAPKGVRGRNSDNSLIREELGWEPAVSLREGLEETYAWIRRDMVARRAAPVAS